MGCASSKDKIAPDPNGNHVIVASDKVLRGDVVHRLESKQQRQAKTRQKQVKIFSDAEHISDRVMEEKERLSLPESQSRATSMTTSQLRSPGGGDAENQRKLDEVSADLRPMPVSGSDLTDTPSTSTQLPANNVTKEPVKPKRSHKKKKSKSKSESKDIEALENGNVISKVEMKSNVKDTLKTGGQTVIPNGVPSNNNVVPFNNNVVVSSLPEIAA